MDIDNVRLNFNSDSLLLLNVSLAVIMFGIALSLEPRNFADIIKYPKAALTGMISQFILLPAMTFLLIIVLEPHPSFALGMMMVAACPGGNISNFMTHLAKGNTALSISLTAISTLAAIVMTPLNLNLWASLYPPTHNILQAVEIEFFSLLKTVSLILGAPLIAGMLFRYLQKELADRISNFLKPVSMLIFIGFVVFALSANWNYFLIYLELVVLLVLVHNLLGLSLGYFSGSVAGLQKTDRRTLAIETGIQNSGLGLLLIFSFFDGLGGMAIIAAWWGIWHIISGLLVSSYWSGLNFSFAQNQS